MRTLFAHVTTSYPIEKFTRDDYNDPEKLRAVVRTFIEKAALDEKQAEAISALLDFVNKNADIDAKQKFLETLSSQLNPRF